MKKTLIAAIVCALVATAAPAQAFNAAPNQAVNTAPAQAVNTTSAQATRAQAAVLKATAKGPTGQTLSATPTKNLPADKTTIITVTGRGYSTKHGIYATFCVVPAKGQKPELCGPFDITGKNNQSVWISSNPPVYGLALAKPFGKNGTFKVKVPVQSKIGDLDCTLLKCAILTRADHTQPDYRKADVIIPVTFK